MKPDEKDGKGGAGKAAAVVAGAGLGAWAGAGIGIAGAFGAISGVLPLAALGAYAAHKLTDTKFAKDLAAGAKQGHAEKTEELRAAALPAGRRASASRTAAMCWARLSRCSR